MHSFLLYIDPGSSNYLVQALVAAVLGAGLYLKTSWWRIKQFFRRKKTPEE
jgi:hypothetical protein